MATKTEKNVQLKINKMTKNIFDQLSVQGLISEDELYLLSDDETGSATWGTIGGELSNQNDLKIMLDSKADKSEIPTVNNPTITFTQGNAVKGSITLNQANDQTISLDAGGGGGGSGDYVPLSTDIAGNKTAATIGTRNNGVFKTLIMPEPIQLSAIGANTFTVGTDCAALSANSFAQGLSCVARGTNSIALGIKAVAGYANTFVWSGDDSPGSIDEGSTGPGTFNIINTSAPDTDILFINGKKLIEIVGGGGGDSIKFHCYYSMPQENNTPGLYLTSIANGDTLFTPYAILNAINYSNKPCLIRGYLRFEPGSNNVFFLLGSQDQNWNWTTTFHWMGLQSNQYYKCVPFEFVYNSDSSRDIYCHCSGSSADMYILGVYEGGEMSNSLLS